MDEKQLDVVIKGIQANPKQMQLLRDVIKEQPSAADKRG